VNEIPGPHLPTVQNDRHHAGFANESTMIITRQRRRHEAALYSIELTTGIAQSGDLDNCAGTEVEARSGGKIK